LAIYRLSKVKKRRYFLRFFDHVVYPEEPIEKPDEVVEYILTIGANGGTSIDTAIRTAIDDLVNRKLNQYTNTIILITDGEDTVETRPEELKENNISLVAIMIQGNNYSLKKLAEASNGKYLRAVIDFNGALRIIEEVKE